MGSELALVTLADDTSALWGNEEDGTEDEGVDSIIGSLRVSITEEDAVPVVFSLGVGLLESADVGDCSGMGSLISVSVQ